MSEKILKSWQKFMLESNKIEREDRINPGDKEAFMFAFQHGIHSVNDILHLHKLLGEYLNEDWVGKFRTVDVIVGNSVPPSSWKVPALMMSFVENISKMDSFTAHNRFQLIHPFQDLNGRTGRLIWMSKSIKEGYGFQIPFLQMYYYQTLERYHKGECQ